MLGALLAGCGHGSAAGASQAEEPASDATHTQRAEPAAPAASAASAEREAEPSSRHGVSASGQPIGAYMGAHFTIATTARDWVIDGSLEALREPLAALADFDYAGVAPGGWLEGLTRMQQAARLTSQAATLDLAATGIATLARTCGECHTQLGGGPRFMLHSAAGASDPDTRPETFSGSMFRHMWAADRMWEGLTGPSDEAWRAGAAVLARTPTPGPGEEAPLPAAFVTALAELRGIGIRATGADSLEARADVYALLLGSCSGCHAHAVPLQF